MKKYKALGVLALLFFFLGASPEHESRTNFLIYSTEPAKIKLYWKDDKGKTFGSIQNLKTFIEKQNEELEFAMNGGMYKLDHSPQGLLIENSLILSPLDTLSGSGNFYLKPNGVFFIVKNGNAGICLTSDFRNKNEIAFATQSGPLLLIDGEVHHAFKKNSQNLNIRNGVGILPDNKVVFAMSKQEVNFYEFAEFFKSIGCKNALYLDGFVSRMYLRQENWKQLDGDFGVIIGVTKINDLSEP